MKIFKTFVDYFLIIILAIEIAVLVYKLLKK